MTSFFLDWCANKKGGSVGVKVNMAVVWLKEVKRNDEQGAQFFMETI